LTGQWAAKGRIDAGRLPPEREECRVAVELKTVDRDEAGIRLDRWFKLHYPGLGFGHLQKLIRSGQVRVDGARVEASARLAAGQAIRVPPLAQDDGRKPQPHAGGAAGDREALEAAILHEDADVIVLNKPYGLAVQGGSGVTRHVDQMLEAFTDRQGRKPRLVHRLDRDTSGVLVVARTRSAAAFLGEAFKARETKKIYWALVAGIPRPAEGRISTFLARDEGAERMRVAKHGEGGADHAVTHYKVADQAGQKIAFLVMRPITGRTHQLRAHAAHIGHPILGDPKYFNVENWELPGGLQNRLHLLARRIVVPHPKGGTLDVTAPLPPHMQQSFAVLGFDEATGEAVDV
jgi:23S rRNA pseudouridine955/2504/2580 synthase